MCFIVIVYLRNIDALQHGGQLILVHFGKLIEMVKE